MLIGAVMLVVLVLAWGANMQKPAEPAAPATPATPAAAPAAAEPTLAEVSDGVKAIKTEVDGLKSDLKSLQDRVESMPKPAPAPDLEPLNTKIAALSKDTETLKALPKKLDDLNQRVGTVDSALGSLRTDLDAIKGDVKKAGTDTARPTEDAEVSTASLVQGSDMLKAGKYKEASDYFRKLTESNPGDARVWYFAAVSRGSATRDWAGETKSMVEKGIEREKAGSPDSAKIDAAFTDLVAAFKPWLEGYRKLAKPR
jgi:outer membrane murein-binding lipoprotein Lpp